MRAMRSDSRSLSLWRRTALSTDEGEATETDTSASALMARHSCVLRAGESALESRTPSACSLASRAREARTPATTSGPSTEPRPASSTPQTCAPGPGFAPPARGLSAGTRNARRRRAHSITLSPAPVRPGRPRADRGTGRGSNFY